jgi:hypothetical protein
MNISQIFCAPLFAVQVIHQVLESVLVFAARRMQLHNKQSAAGTSSLRLFIYTLVITGISSHVLLLRILPARFASFESHPIA